MSRKIDPFALQMPWRVYLRDALVAEARYRRAAVTVDPGAVRSRLESSLPTVRQAVHDCIELAQLGDRLDYRDTTPAVDRIGEELRFRVNAATRSAELAEQLVVVTATHRTPTTDISEELAALLSALDELEHPE